MSSVENFIIFVAMVAAFGGGLVLLACLAGTRAKLVKAFNTQQELELRDRQLQESMQEDQKTENPANKTPALAAQ